MPDYELLRGKVDKMVELKIFPERGTNQLFFTNKEIRIVQVILDFIEVPAHMDSIH